MPIRCEMGEWPSSHLCHTLLVRLDLQSAHRGTWQRRRLAWPPTDRGTMLFRAKQMREIGSALAGTFVQRVTAFVRAELQGRPGDVTEAEIDALVQRANRYGFTLERTIVAFVLAA